MVATLADVMVKVSADTKALNDNLDDALRDTRKFDQETQKATKSAASGFDKVGASMAKVRTIVAGLGLAIGGAAIGSALANATTSALAFSDAMTEVATLGGAAAGEIDVLTSAAREQAKTFASAPTTQAKAIYQIISAGASSAAEATDILTQANMLAVGGITDVATAADGLTTIVNAYAQTGLSAADASDAMFVAMRAGKTTIAELSSGLGQVVPIAASVGVSFDEVAAAVAALTTQGLSTSQSITSLRQVIAGIAKPTSEASRMAKQLGIDFSVTALQTQGLSAFLGEVIEKTGGSSEKLAQLFGSVEALNAILAFAGGAGASFNSILDQMGLKAGAAGEAFATVASGPGFQFRQLMSNLGDLMLSIGNIIVAILLPAVQFLNAHFDLLVAVLRGVAIYMALAFGPQILATVVAGLTMVRNAILALNVAMTANPVGMWALAISILISVMYQWVSAAGGVVAAIMQVGNVILGAVAAVKNWAAGLSRAGVVGQVFAAIVLTIAQVVEWFVETFMRGIVILTQLAAQLGIVSQATADAAAAFRTGGQAADQMRAQLDALGNESTQTAQQIGTVGDAAIEAATKIRTSFEPAADYIARPIAEGAASARADLRSIAEEAERAARSIEGSMSRAGGAAAAAGGGSSFSGRTFGFGYQTPGGAAQQQQLAIDESRAAVMTPVGQIEDVLGAISRAFDAGDITAQERAALTQITQMLPAAIETWWGEAYKRAFMQIPRTDVVTADFLRQYLSPSALIAALPPRSMPSIAALGDIASATKGGPGVVRALTPSSELANAILPPEPLKIMGFNRGGAFTVGGQPGMDRNLVSFKAGNRERVTVETVRQQQQGQGRSVNVEMTVVTPDANSFKQSEDQILFELYQKLRRLEMRV